MAKRGTAADVQAAMPVRLSPRPARRALAISAAIGRFDRTRTAQVRSNRPLQLLPLFRTLQPQQSYHSESGGNAKHPPLPTYVSSSLPVKATALLACADSDRVLHTLSLPVMRRAVTRAATALRCAALRCTALALHRAAHWQLSPLSTPTARVRTLRCGAG